MSLFWRIDKKVKDFCAKFYRKQICGEMQSKLHNREVSIVSSNCIGGILSHDLGLQFASPTVNLFFMARDFVKFATNLGHYVGMVPQIDEAETRKRGYPVAVLDDIRLFAVHYQSMEELQAAWKRRSARIHWDNLFLVMTDRNGMTAEDLESFARLPYPKVLFSAKKYPQYDFVIYVDAFRNEDQVGQLQFFADFRGHRYYEKYFDFVRWLNCEEL